VKLLLLAGADTEIMDNVSVFNWIGNKCIQYEYFAVF